MKREKIKKEKSIEEVTADLRKNFIPDTYHVVMKFNGKIIIDGTNDLDEFILKHKPIFLKTTILFSITLGDKICDKVVMAQQGRAIFNNKIYRSMFINKLIFK